MLEVLECLVMSSELYDELVSILYTGDLKDLLDPPLILVETPCHVLFLFRPGRGRESDLGLIQLCEVELLL